MGTIEQYGTANDGTPLHWKVLSPGPGKHPPLILLPGGGFKHLFGIPSAVVSNLVAAGYLVFTQTEYRLAPPNKIAGQTSLGRFPDQTNDVEIAPLAAQNHPISNGEKPVVVGGSAGACHAMWLAATGWVKASACLSPPTQLDDPGSQYGPYWQDVQNYAPDHLAEASPNNMLTAGSSPIFIVFFAEDHIPAPQFTLAVSKLESLGLPYESLLLDGPGHSWDAWQVSGVPGQVISFLGSPVPPPRFPTNTSGKCS